ncbi:MAG: hypothetical protein AAF624_06205 [Bacteroidota bacterium]
MIDALLQLAPSIRYAAVYRDGALTSKQEADTPDASSAESDRYEELLVNPALLTLATQRGNIDCGGLDYVLVRYGHFFQFVLPQPWGHVSVCIAADADPIELGIRIRALVADAD